MPDVQEYSLLKDLTDLSNPDPAASGGIPGALELLVLLLTAAGNDACNATSNAQVMYRIVRRGRDICNEIMEHMLTVKQHPHTDDGFRAFQKYTKMVQPLETFLYGIVSIPQRLDQTAIGLSTKRDLIAPYEDWQSDRLTLRQKWDSLTSGDFSPPAAQPPSDYDAAEFYDDLSCLVAAYRHIDSYQGKAEQSTADVQFNKAVKSVATTYSSIVSHLRGSKSTNKFDAVFLSVRSAYVLSGILIRKIPESMPPVEREALLEVDRRLWKTADTWNEANREVLLKILECVKDGKAISTALKTAWKDFEDKLLADLPPEDFEATIRELMEYVGRCKRAYYNQALAVVTECFSLERNTRAGSGVTKRDAASLESVLNLAKDALSMASSDVDQAGLTGLSWETVEGSAAYQKLGLLKAAIEQCYTVHGIATKASVATNALNNAKEEDQKVIQKLTENWSSIEARRRLQRRRVKVTVKVFSRDPGQFSVPSEDDTVTYDKLDELERIDGVLWTIGSSYCNFDILTQNPVFYVAQQGTLVEVDRHVRLEQLQQGGGLILYLGVDDRTKFNS